MYCILHGAPLSPFVRKVMYLLKAMDAEYKLKPVAPGALPEDFITISPLNKIPVLQEDEWTQPDSSVICHYLLETHDHPSLTGILPAEARARARVRWLEKYADYELSPQLTFTVFRQRTLNLINGKPCNEEAVQESLLNKVPGVLDYLEQQLGNQAFFVGTQITLADIAITSQMVNFLHAGETIDGSRWPALSAYFQRMYQTPIWQALIAREKTTLDKILGDKHYNLSPL